MSLQVYHPESVIVLILTVHLKGLDGLKQNFVGLISSSFLLALWRSRRGGLQFSTEYKPCYYLLRDFVVCNWLSSWMTEVLIGTLGLCVLCTARVAVVKSRDMHWSLLAQRDQRDISLSSLRMLIVADGANPCEFTCSFLFNNKKKTL